LPLSRLRVFARVEVVRVVWLPDGRWLLTDHAGGAHEQVRLLPGALVTGRWIALRWRCLECGRRLRILLLHDNCDPAQRRRLAVRLGVTDDAQLYAADQAGG